jgi:hypothetical protein
MDLEAWLLPVSRLGLVGACATALCGPVAAKDSPQDAKLKKDFMTAMDGSLKSMLEVPQILQVVGDVIVISSIHNTQCNGTTQPNVVVNPTALQRSVEALNAINNANAQGKKVTILVEPSHPQPTHLYCFAPDYVPKVSSKLLPAAPASAASR